MSIDTETVVSITRQNSGRHLLDSGDYYGRVYDSPAPEGLFAVTDDGNVHLTVTGLLTEHATVVGYIQEMLRDAWGTGKRGEKTSFTTPDGEEHDATDLDNFAIGVAVMEALGYERVCRDNTYNRETDLDQEFVWEVWLPEHSDHIDGDWFYAEDAVILIYAHTGCDVRGGYSTPLAVEFDGEYAFPLDLVVGFYPADEETEAWMERRDFEKDRFEGHYTHHPQYDFRQEVPDFVRHQAENEVLVFKNPQAGEDGEPAELAFGYTFDIRE